jgi:hypothetical protein
MHYQHQNLEKIEIIYLICKNKNFVLNICGRVFVPNHITGN